MTKMMLDGSRPSHLSTIVMRLFAADLLLYRWDRLIIPQ